MRIIHLLKHCNHGHGNAHVAVDLACVQAEQGWSVAYASAGGDYEELLASRGVTLATIPQITRNPLTALSSLTDLVKLCRSFRPDIIHAHMMTAAATGYLASRLTGTPLVTTVHNSFDRHSLLMRLGDRVVAVSEAERRALIARGFDPDRVDVVLNGPNLSPRESWLASDTPPPETGRPCVTTVCGLHRRKGVADLLTAFARATAAHPAWTLNIVGDGPDRLELERLARETLMLGERVRFLGSIPQPKAVLHQSDIFVLASYADPCSLAVAEALYAGCATIATAVGGTPELLDGGRRGLLVPPGQPDELAATLTRLISQPAELATWRQNARAGADMLTIDRVVRDYARVYAGLKTMKPAKRGEEWPRASADRLR